MSQQVKSGQLTLSYSSGSFDPVSRSYTNVSANQSGQDFRWSTVVSPTIRVISPNGGELTDYVEAIHHLDRVALEGTLA